MLKEKLMEDLKDSMRSQNTIRKNTVQLIRAAILQIEKDEKVEVDDKRVIDIIAKEAKKRKDATAEFEKSGREDLISQNNEELLILSEYLPKQLTIEEIESVVKRIIEETGASGMKDMGNVMKASKEEMGASADGKAISDSVKKLLN